VSTRRRRSDGRAGTHLLARARNERGARGLSRHRRARSGNASAFRRSRGRHGGARARKNLSRPRPGTRRPRHGLHDWRSWPAGRNHSRRGSLRRSLRRCMRCRRRGSRDRRCGRPRRFGMPRRFGSPRSFGTRELRPHRAMSYHGRMNRTARRQWRTDGGRSAGRGPSLLNRRWRSRVCRRCSGGRCFLRRRHPRRRDETWRRGFVGHHRLVLSLFHVAVRVGVRIQIGRIEPI